jgi:radical SAM superfamily enzyme YgiQ (UPF0313 family)
MKTLLIYPQYPADTFWSFKHILKFASKRAAFPPLGLLTIASMLPEKWEKKLVDMNVSTLKDKDIEWADCVFISAMIVQKNSVKEVIERCRRLNVKIVAGGPLFTTGYEEFEGIDHFVLGEAEETLPVFLDDLKNGCSKHIYVSDKRPSLTKTPIPMWDLINFKHYATLCIQYTRGCPYDCEFCDVIIMNGRVPRNKEMSQVLREFDALYERGWRGPVFIVDDNFIGNKIKAKKMLREIVAWQEKRGYPFRLFTQVSLNLAADEELMRLMTDAGCNKVFIGLETPIEASLAECNKFLNKTGDMVAAVKKIQNFGMQVMGGFIVGFDNDPPSIFENQINFIQRMGVVSAMLGILTALPKTKLYNRLKGEGRLLKTSSGDNTDGSLNFVPRMGVEALMNGYRKIMQTLYSPEKYYQRIITFLEEYRPAKRRQRISLALAIASLRTFLKSVWYLGVVGESRRYYWKLVTKALFKYHHTFPEAISMAIQGFHFRKVTKHLIKQEGSNLCP